MSSRETASDAAPGPDAVMATAVSALRQLILAAEHYRLAVAVHLGVTVNESQLFSYLLVNGPMGQTELARALDLTSGTVTAMVDRLEARGFTERRTHPHDRRRNTVALSECGERELAQVRHWMSHALEVLPPEQIEIAGSLFETVASSLREYTDHVVDMNSKFERPRRRI